MKKNMRRVMEKLEIDRGLYELMRQLWKHSYRVISGYKKRRLMPIVLILDKDSGDEWFEVNSGRYGLEKAVRGECCKNFEFLLQPDINACGTCGAGINGRVVYRGRLISNPYLYLKLIQ